MKKYFLCMVIGLDGFYKGPNGDITWHKLNDEFNESSVVHTSGVDTLT